jgi:Response regulator containing CheY-like receiver domain and AraC-type DNA-binding domain
MRPESMPFHAWRARPRVMPDAHSHTDLELNLPLDGTLHYFFAGRFIAIGPGSLAVFWAGMPHRLVAVEPAGTEYLCLTLPLAWFLSWGLDSAFTRRLLSGELAAGDDPLDAALFARWAADLSGSGADRQEARRVVLLEVEARLRRLARQGSTGTDGSGPSYGGGARPQGHSRPVEDVAALVGSRYEDPDLTVASLAAELGLHPNYILTIFRNEVGMTLWEYVTRLRVSHAQRLLLTTEWTVARVAQASGFGSPGRFFAVFKSRCGVTPRQYRVVAVD